MSDIKKQRISSIYFQNKSNRVFIAMVNDDATEYYIVDTNTFEELIQTDVTKFFNELCYNNKPSKSTIKIKGKPIDLNLFEEMIDMTIDDLSNLIGYLNHTKIDREMRFLNYKLKLKQLRIGTRFNTFVYVKKGSTSWMDTKWFDINPLMYNYEGKVGKIINKDVNDTALYQIMFDDGLCFTFDKETLIPLAKE